MTERKSQFVPPKEVLYDALDASAPDSASWKRGYEAYLRTRSDAGESMQAYYDALDASAPDARRWKAAWAVIDRALREMSDPRIEAQKREAGLILDVGFYEKADYGKLESQDTIYVNTAAGVFGVFDGMGGNGGNPRAASQVAAEAVGSRLAAIQPDDESSLIALLQRSFQEGRQAVQERGEGGSTVATAIKMCVIDGQQVMGVAHAGDTRLFKYSKADQQYTALTADQSNGSSVRNGFTPAGRRPWYDPDEYIVCSIEPCDRIMLCSDGITGDLEHQFLSDNEFIDAFTQETPSQAAERFYQLSKKDDDKSVVVIDVK